MSTVTIIESHHLQAPADAVWDVLARYDLDPQWRRGVLSMTPSPPGPATPGTTTVEEMKVGGRRYTNVGEVRAVVPGREVRWRTVEGAEAHGSRSVVPDGDGCTVTLELHVTPHGFERLLAPVLAKVLRRTMCDDLRRLERLVAERRPSTVGGHTTVTSS